MTHPRFRAKLDAVGFGVFIPFFFVVSGVELDVGALFSGGAASLAAVPVFLLALLVVRGLPAMLLYRRLAGARGAAAAGLLQATSLAVIVTAVEIGAELDAFRPAVGAALVVAGLLSVVLFPPLALALLRAGGGPVPGPLPGSGTGGEGVRTQGGARPRPGSPPVTRP